MLNTDSFPMFLRDKRASYYLGYSHGSVVRQHTWCCCLKHIAVVPPSLPTLRYFAMLSTKVGRQRAIYLQNTKLLGPLCN